MSASEAERFANDLKAKPDMLDELKKSAGGLGLAGVVQFAKSKGYSIDVGDVKSYIEAKANAELTDEQLERIAGGKGNPNITNVIGPVANAVEGFGATAAANSVTAVIVVT